MNWINAEEFDYLVKRYRITDGSIRMMELRKIAGMDVLDSEIRFLRNLKKGINQRLEAYCIANVSITQLQNS